MLPTIEWNDEAVVMIDQRKLPGAEIYVTCRTPKEVARAIKTMVIRGAPAIGVAAAMGLALGVRQSKATGTTKLATEFYKLCEMMAGDAPDGRQPVLGHRSHEARVCRGRRARASRSIRSRRGSQREARTIHDEDVASCRAMGAHGASVVPDDGARADALQCGRAGDGRIRHGAGRDSRRRRAGKEGGRPRRRDAAVSAGRAADGVGADARRHRHDRHHRQHVRRASCAAARSISSSSGADRIAANGDVANKIGTYTVAVLAKEHGIPFYVAAPISTIDLSTPDGSRIPIEERNAREVTHLGADAADAAKRPQFGTRRSTSRPTST